MAAKTFPTCSWRAWWNRRRRGRPGLDTERKYVCVTPNHAGLRLINNASDGATPEEKTKQIVALAPILKGQQHNQQTKASQPQQSQQPSQLPIRPQQQTVGHDDLIDFGQSAPAPDTSAPAGQTNPMHFQLDTPPGMQAPLQPGQPLKRVDTRTNDLDEFVDAPGY